MNTMSTYEKVETLIHDEFLEEEEIADMYSIKLKYVEEVSNKLKS